MWVNEGRLPLNKPGHHCLRMIPRSTELTSPDHYPFICEASQATVSLVERKLMEADRLKMCGMMWLKEHETCSPMGAVHRASGDSCRTTNHSREQHTSDFVVDVGGSLGRYLLNDVHGGPVVAAHSLIMTTDHAFRSPQRKDSVAAVRVVVVAADAVPLCHGQSGEGHRGRLLAVWHRAAVTAPPQHDQQNDDDQEDDATATKHPHQPTRLHQRARL
ncbi:hypothetical protein EYF80_022510 [Liparis tanakae]|uniref:Uncharacterized protein n=1 Tax=Liparis tanakae TaxID=230148 RepID=A0A4Z2HNW9_9TELE|nr:hypothetical protein EYF80_022510 [Liparis tanakae]